MQVLVKTLLLVFGILNAIWPYKLARFEEQLDSIGSKRSWSEVEPAEWKVVLTRLVGVAMAVVGAFGLIVG